MFGSRPGGPCAKGTETKVRLKGAQRPSLRAIESALLVERFEALLNHMKIQR